MTTPSKITDYFPPSPTTDTVEKEEIEEGKYEKVDGEKPDNKLLESSVAITPKSSPIKEEKTDTDIIPKTDKEPKSEDKSKSPSCKKSLPVEPDTKKTDTTATQQSTKSKRKGRRKKRDPKAELQNTGSPVPNGPAKPKSARKKQTESSEVKNTLLTDYFPVRRSDRKSKNEIEKEKTEALHYKLLNSIEDGLEVQDIENKGRGVVATKPFKKGEFVVEYAGDLINIKESKQRDEEYSKDPSKGCYMYYFNFKNKNYCIDATSESGKLGRLLNHCKTSGNCQTKLVGIKDRPYLILVASRDINIGEELSYDYGDRSKASLESHPWLKS